MTTESPQIRILHENYCRLTGYNPQVIRLDWMRRLAWEHFIHNGNTIEHLRLVIGNIKRGIKEGRRNPGALKFSNLIQDGTRWEEERVLAEGEERNRKLVASPQAKVLSQFRPTIDQINAPMTAQPVAISVGEWIKKMRQAVDNPQ